MALFRRLLYRKPPDRLLEISEKIYVFDCCFSTTFLKEDEYKAYSSGIVGQLHDYFPEGSFMVCNFREGDRRSKISDILSEYDMTVMEYPLQYEGCPLLPLEVIQHFLRSSESWLSVVGQQNILLMHCERGGWPILAFMLAALLLHRKQYKNELKALDAVYKQAPRELLQLLSPIDPQPSHLRYLRYISDGIGGSQRRPSNMSLTLNSLILRAVPDFNNGGGFRPTIRVHGLDPASSTGRSPMVLFSKQKSKLQTKNSKKGESTTIKINIRCRVQGDVVLDCIDMGNDIEREVLIFRFMFNTWFVRSNTLVLNREEIDIKWSRKEQFPRDLVAEVVFLDLDCSQEELDEAEGDSSEEFFEVEDILDADSHDGKKESPSNTNARGNEDPKSKTASLTRDISRMSVTSPKLDKDIITAKKSSMDTVTEKRAEALPPSSGKSQTTDLQEPYSSILAGQEYKQQKPPGSQMKTGEIWSLSRWSPRRRGSYVSPVRHSHSRHNHTTISPSTSRGIDVVDGQHNPLFSSRSLPSQRISAPVALPTSKLPPLQVQSSPAPPPPPPQMRTPPPPPPLSHLQTQVSRSPPPPPPPLPQSGPSIPQARIPPPPPDPPPSIGQHRGPPPPPPPPRPQSGAPPPRPPPGLGMGPPPPPPPKLCGCSLPSSLPPGACSPARQGPSRATGTPYGNRATSQGRIRGLPRSGSPSTLAPRRSLLKPLHWVKVTRAVQGSLWADLQRSDEAPSSDFDVTELEALFSAMVPKSSDNKRDWSRGRCKSIGSKQDTVHLIDLRRANNCEIMLTKVKMPFSDLMAAVVALDDSILNIDQVENLIKFCPTKEEIELLKGYSGDKEKLGKCEKFFLELMKIPRVESKLRVFAFKIDFRYKISDLRKNFQTINFAYEEIRNSTKLKDILRKILYLGNQLNQGTSRGSAVGFRLDSLLKLIDTRATNNATTLMHYLCKVLASRSPHLLDFHLDWVNLDPASKIQLKILAEEMEATVKGLEKVESELDASENDGPVSYTFCRMLKEFVTGAQAEVQMLTRLYKEAGKNADALILYFSEDPKRCPFEQVVATLLNFVHMFQRAHEENCKLVELEKKKAQKKTTEKSESSKSIRKNTRLPTR